jgi:hypothetical protein
VNDSLTGTSDSLVTALSYNTKYYWRAYAANVGGASAWVTDSFATVKQNLLALTAGWSIISFNVTPTDSQATTIFGSMSHLVIAKNNSGGVFVPAYSANSIGSVHNGEAYQIYVSADDTIRVAGSPIDPATTPIALGTGWSMLGYLPQVDMPITTALAGITSQIVIVKNTDGNVYSPDYGANSIGTMHVGEGYVIYMKSGVALTYPTGLGKTLLASSGTITPKNKHYVSAKMRSDNSATVLLKRVVENAHLVPDSTEIAAYDASGTLVGSGVVMHGSAAFTVWGDNSMTKEKDGLTAKEAMTFKIWLPSGEEYTANYVGANSDGYAAQAIMQGNMSVQHTLKITQCALASVSPNPFRGNVRIGFDVATVNGKDMQNVEINVYDVRGVLVRQLAKGLYKTGHYSVMWDGSDHIGSNMYIVTMKTDNFSQKMKLFKVK